MEIVEALRTRKSIRCFKPDPIPQKVLKEILEAAMQAPSTMNTQPWEFVVLSGEVLEKVRKSNIENLSSGVEPNWVMGWPPDSVYRRRQVDVAKQLFTLMDIPREDKAMRKKWRERGFRYFDASTVIIILVDRALTEKGPLLDIGAVMQSICLAALHYGLGTCIEDQGTAYPDILRKFSGIPESKRIIIAVADWEFPANRIESPRESVDSITTWCGFV